MKFPTTFNNQLIERLLSERLGNCCFVLFLGWFISATIVPITLAETYQMNIDKTARYSMADELNPAVNNFIKAEDPTDIFWLIRMAKLNQMYYSKLAYWYEIGRGGLNEPDFEKAFNWYFRAASEANDGFAAYKLGEFYQQGIYVAEDLEKSFYWYDQSAIRSYPPALRKLGEIYQTGNNFVEADLALSLQYYQSAAEMLDARSQMQTALLYQLPPFDVRKQVASIDWYLKYLENPDQNKVPLAETRDQLLVRKDCLSGLEDQIAILFSENFYCANRGSIETIANHLDVKPVDANEQSLLFRTRDLHQYGRTMIYDSKDGEQVSKDASALLRTSSSVMRLNFADNRLLESITYLFPAIAYQPSIDFFLDNEILPDDRLKAIDIRDRFVSIFGTPNVIQETVDTVLYRWLFSDGIVLQIYRRLPTTHTLVSFHNPVIEQQRLKNELEIQALEESQNRQINLIIREDREEILSRFSDLLDLVNPDRNR